MYLTFRRVAVIGSLIGLAVLVAGIIYTHNLASYTANLDNRPLNAGLVGAVDTIDPALVFSHEERLAASAIYEGLVYFDQDSRTIKPLIASGWKYSADGKSLILDLKRKVKFHNGKKLTANDVKAAWENNFSTTKDWSSISLFLSIKGSSERLEGKTPDITGIEVVDANTIKINFVQPNAAFIFMLTNPIFWVYDCEDKVEIAPGTGPFIYKEKKDHTIVLLRNEKYHRNPPRLPAINFKIFSDVYEALGEYKAGRLDYLDAVPFKEIKNIKATDEYKDLYIEKPLLDTYLIGFNVNKEPFAGNYLIRRAINYAIDRKAITDTILGGAYRPAKGVIPMGAAGYNSEMRGYSYDLDKAKKLLEEAGYPMGEELKPLILTYNNDEGHQVVAEAVAQQLAELGVQVQIQPMDWDYYKKQLGKMDIAFFRLSWHADYPDADNFLYSLFHSSKLGISNYFGYHNPQVDKILDASREEIKSQQERINLLKRAEEIIVDDAPCLWLFQKNAGKLMGKNVNALNIDCMEMIDWSKVEILKPSLEGEKKTPDSNKV